MTSSMNPPYPSLTRTWHTDTYPAISPSLPALSQRHKTILITGGETTIGRATILAFAAASAHRIIMLGGQHAQPLEETRDFVVKQYPKCYVEWFNIDVAEEGKVVDVLDTIVGRLKPDWRWDVLVLMPEAEDNERRLVEKREYDEGDQGVKEWWKAFELNLKANYILIHHFLPKRSRKASIIASVPRSIHLSSPTHISGQSAYLSSKIALVKFLEVVAAENPDLFVASYDPGNVPHPFRPRTKNLPPRAISNQSDTPTLPAHFAVWLCSPCAKFVRGKYVWANWDVGELEMLVLEMKARSIAEVDRDVGNGMGTDSGGDGGGDTGRNGRDEVTTNDRGSGVTTNGKGDDDGEGGAWGGDGSVWGTLNILGWPCSPSQAFSVHSRQEFGHRGGHMPQAQNQQQQNGTNDILETIELDDWNSRNKEERFDSVAADEERGSRTGTPGVRGTGQGPGPREPGSRSPLG